MSRFLETIKILHGQAQALRFHEQRIERTLVAFYGRHTNFYLPRLLAKQTFGHSLQRCRCLYDIDNIHINVEEYLLPTIRSLRAIEVGSTVSYAFKFSDRTQLQRVYSLREDSDDVIMLRDGYLTDTTRMNIALYDGSTWWTPAEPLLAGTKRSSLLEQGVLTPRQIHLRELQCYSRIRLFNALIEWEDALEVSTQFVKFGRINA